MTITNPHCASMTLCKCRLLRRRTAAAATCRNFETYLDTLRACGYQPKVEGDGDIIWPIQTAAEP
jgi:hypothetical protein